MQRIHKFLSRKNIYGLVFILASILICVSLFVPSSSEKIKPFIFNPFWPSLLIILDTYLQTKEKESARINEKKIDALSGVIRARIDNKEERPLIKSILDSMKDGDLMEYNNSLIESIEFEEKVEDAGKIQGNSQGVNI